MAINVPEEALPSTINPVLHRYRVSQSNARHFERQKTVLPHEKKEKKGRISALSGQKTVPYGKRLRSVCLSSFYDTWTIYSKTSELI